MNTIFVYGLLMPGFSMHHMVEPFIVRTSPATARGRLYEAEYPAARFGEDGEIDGFVFWLDPARLDEILSMLDEAEDEGVMYERRVIPTHTDEGPVDAFAYHYLFGSGETPEPPAAGF